MTSLPIPITVVVASVNGLPYPLECLEAIERERATQQVSVVVADCTGPATVRAISERFPWVQVVAFDKPMSVPALRSAAVREVKTLLVAITEDHCVPRPGWIAAMIDTLQSTGWVAAGGGVENGATHRAIDWTVYFCEYAGLMSPIVDGPSKVIPGMNAVYDLQRLGDWRQLMERDWWENRIHDAFVGGGFSMGLDNRIVVDHRKHFSYAMFASERFHYSRAYAGDRVAGLPWSSRIVWALKTPLLPPLIVLRIVRAVMSRRRHVGWLLRTAPLVALFSVIWAVGELVGYLRGPGDSLVKIK